MSLAHMVRRLTSKQNAFTASVYTVLALIVLWPVFSVPIPGLSDTLNHLARIHVIIDRYHSLALQQFYEVHWNFAPYLGMDLIVAGLTHFMTLYQAGRVFMGLCVLMPVLSTMALSAVARGRIGLLPATSFLLSYNYILSWGFLNYLFSACAAVLLFAGWVASAGWGRWYRSALFAFGFLILYFCHVFACFAYVVMVVGFEIAKAGRARFQPLSSIAMDWLAAASQSIPALCFAIGLRLDEAVPGAIITVYGDGVTKLRAVLSPLLFPGTDQATMATIGFVLTSGLALSYLRGLQFSPRVWPAAVAMAIICVIIPNALLSTWGFDFRLPLIVCILLVGGTTLTLPIGRTGRALLLIAVVLITFAKSVEARRVLLAVDDQVSEVRQVVAHMPIGQRLLVIQVDDPNAPARIVPFTLTMHIPMVAVIDRDAFVPSLFVGMKLVHFRTQFTMSSSPNSPPIGLAELREGLIRTDSPDQPQFFNFGSRVYWYEWPKKFDYVLILHFGDQTQSLPPILHRVATSKIADLYKISSQ